MFSKCVSYDEYDDIVIVKMYLGLMHPGRNRINNRYYHYSFRINEYGGFEYIPAKANKKAIYFIIGYFLFIIGVLVVPNLINSEIDPHTLITGLISLFLIIASIIGFIVWDHHSKIKAAKRFLEFNYDFEARNSKKKGI